MRFSPVLFYLFFFQPLAFAQEKVAVIVSSGDLEGLEAPMKALENQAMKTYSDLGYRVVLLGGVDQKGFNLTTDNFKKTLAGFRDVKDLRLDFIGHGALASDPGKKDARPSIAISEERRAMVSEVLPTSNEPMSWYATNRLTLDQRDDYRTKSEMFGYSPVKQDSISQNDIKEGLQEFRTNNAEAKTTMNLVNCFSGALAQDLRKTPNTIVFANSPLQESALEISELNDFQVKEGEKVYSNDHPGSGLAYYYKVLSSKLDGGMSFMEARKQANLEFSNHVKGSPLALYHVGRSPVFESVMGWCEEGKPGQVTKAGQSAKEKAITQSKELKSIEENLKNEISRTKADFDNAMNKPVGGESNQTTGQFYKEIYDMCLDFYTSKMKEQKKESSDDWVKDWKEMRKQLASDPGKPLMILLDHYNAILSDPMNADQIFRNVRQSLDDDYSELMRQNVSPHRWGAIKNLLESMDDGTLTKEKVIGDLKMTIRKLKKDCGTRASVHCESFARHDDLLQSYLKVKPKDQSWVQDEKAKTCQINEKYFECLAERAPGTLTSKVRFYRSPVEKPSRGSPQELCQKEEWVKAQRIEKNLLADSRCVETFLESAPKAEWDNLVRIQELGSRDVQGRTFVNSKRPANKSGKVH